MKYENVCQKLRKCAKIEKDCQNLKKYEKVYQKQGKCAKSRESMPELEKV